MTAVLLLLLQAGGWIARPVAATVGDTVELLRSVRAAPDVRARLDPLAVSDLIEPLDPPASGYAEGEITVRYAVAFFEAGQHAVPMPDIELLYPDGRVEVVPGDTARVTVASVLPAGTAPPEPRPSFGPLRREERRAAPLLLLVTGAVAATGLWALLRRRKGPAPVPSAGVPERPEPPIDRWVAAGEARAVATAVSERLRAVLAQREPTAARHLDTEQCIAAVERSGHELPVRDLVAVLRQLERARFAPAVPSDVVQVVRRAEELRYLLEGAPAAGGA